MSAVRPSPAYGRYRLKFAVVDWLLVAYFPLLVWAMYDAIPSNDDETFAWTTLQLFEAVEDNYMAHRSTAPRHRDWLFRNQTIT